MDRDKALTRAIEAAGGVSALATALGIAPPAVSQWKRCPPLRVIEVEALTGGAVTRSELRPDLYPAEKKSA